LDFKPYYDYNNRKEIRIFSKKNKDKFNNSICKMESVLRLNDNEISNIKWNKFIDVISQTFNSSFPLVRISRKKCKDKQWITKAIKKSSKTKENLYNKWKQNKTIENYNTYRSYKKRFNSVLKKAKKYYFLRLFDNDNDSKKMWNEINSIIKNKNSSTTIEKIILNDVALSSQEDIAEALNNYFSTVGENLNNNFPKNNNNYKNYMPEPLDKSIRLTNMSITDTVNIIKNLADKNSSGIDQISQKLLKYVITNISPILTKLINLSIKECTYPDCLKRAQIIPLYKGGDKSNCSNYRPISLLSCFNKVFEKKYIMTSVNLLKTATSFLFNSLALESFTQLWTH